MPNCASAAPTTWARPWAGTPRAVPSSTSFPLLMRVMPVYPNEPVRVVVPGPACHSSPVPDMALATMRLSLRSNARTALFITAPVPSAPAVPPAPICKVPSSTMVSPEDWFSPPTISTPPPVLVSAPEPLICPSAKDVVPAVDTIVPSPASRISRCITMLASSCSPPPLNVSAPAESPRLASPSMASLPPESVHAVSDCVGVPVSDQVPGEVFSNTENPRYLSGAEPPPILVASNASADPPSRTNLFRPVDSVASTMPNISLPSWSTRVEFLAVPAYLMAVSWLTGPM
ncbi:hypothetical protein D3C71_1369390 [compost metagenome]